MYCSVRIFNLHSVFRICQEISIRDRLDGVGGGRINGGHSEGATGPRHPNARKTSFLILLKLTNLDPFRKIVDQICLVFLFLGYPTLGPGSLDPVCLARPLLSLLPPPAERKSCDRLWWGSNLRVFLTNSTAMQISTRNFACL